MIYFFLCFNIYWILKKLKKWLFMLWIIMYFIKCNISINIKNLGKEKCYQIKFYFEIIVQWISWLSLSISSLKLNTSLLLFISIITHNMNSHFFNFFNIQYIYEKKNEFLFFNKKIKKKSKKLIFIKLWRYFSYAWSCINPH